MKNKIQPHDSLEGVSIKRQSFFILSPFQLSSSKSIPNTTLFDNAFEFYKSIGTVSYACSYIFNSYLGADQNNKLPFCSASDAIQLESIKHFVKTQSVQFKGCKERTFVDGENAVFFKALLFQFCRFQTLSHCASNC